MKRLRLAIVALLACAALAFSAGAAYADEREASPVDVAPTLAKTSVVLTKWQDADILINNVGYNFDAEVTGGNTKIASVSCYGYDNYVSVYGYKAGSTTFTIKITKYGDGYWDEETYEYVRPSKTYTLKLQVAVVDITISSAKMLGTGITLYKGEYTNLKVKGNTYKVNGVKKTLKAKFSSASKSIATVSSTGKIVAKGYGMTTITVKAGEFTKDVLVSVGAKDGVLACRWAVSKTPATYSQPERMQEGKFDCSSLTGRAYGTRGMYLGAPKGWAGTAADQAKWCASTNRVVCDGSYDCEIMQPGDLIFYRYDYNGVNGRFRNIDHVALYIGNYQKVEVRDGIRGVSQWGGDTATVMVGRPTQTCYPVAAVSKVKVKKASATSAKITWKKTAGITGYQIYRSPNTGKFTKIATVSAKKTSYVNKKLKAGTTYYYKVRCYKKINGKTYYGPFSTWNTGYPPSITL